MYKRLVIISILMIAAMVGLAGLGYHSVHIWARGIEGARMGEFAKAAESIRRDIKRKLDEFIEAEQSRPYTHYQYTYIPDDPNVAATANTMLQSPLSGSLYNNDFAYGNFEIDDDGNVLTPNDPIAAQKSMVDPGNEFSKEVRLNTTNIRDNLLPVIEKMTSDATVDSLESAEEPKADKTGTVPDDIESAAPEVVEEAQARLSRSASSKTSKVRRNPGKQMQIEILAERQQKAQVFRQRRDIVSSNRVQNQLNMQDGGQVEQDQIASDVVRSNAPAAVAEPARQPASTQAPASAQAESQPGANARQSAAVDENMQSAGQVQQMLNDRFEERAGTQADTVEIRVEPFEPVVVPDAGSQSSVFAGQVFLVRKVKIEDQQLVQGFQLAEDRLVEEVRSSAEQIIGLHYGMDFRLPQIDAKPASGEPPDAAYTATLDFGFGYIILDLIETDPARIARQIRGLKSWYFSIITLVLLALTLGLASLWKNARAQLKLARKKDDFISAVSHELRTPLTSLRMYSEMLEKNWIKSEDKLNEYYRSMRQESERLSRLIENVLDFSRIQRGRKKYSFEAGDINRCIGSVVEMMRPYAAQAGFTIETQLGELEQTAFDADAVTQIVVNLIDNAVKYARDAEDKTIIVRTARADGSVIIEIEDHGPGIPARHRKKVFEEFYRLGPESTRETTGTGLGLALVHRFAKAHRGFVEILSAKPTGTVFRVGLGAQS